MNSDAWISLGDVVGEFLPLATFAAVTSIATFMIFVRNRPFAAKAKQAVGMPPGAPQDDEFGALVGLSYVLMAALFGMVFGILISVMGGFSKAAASGSLAASVVAAVGLAIGVVGSLFAESGRIPLRRPVGAIAFLITFVVAGLYWSARLP